MIVLVIVAIAAIGGYLRGLVQEMLSLAAWVLTLFAIHALHTPLTQFIQGFTDEPISSSVLAFALLLLIPSGAMKLIAKAALADSGKGSLNFFDKVLGLGFGMVKGVIIAVLAFSILALGYDAHWGISGRPNWITSARSYAFINAASDQLVEMIEYRRRELSGADDAGATKPPK